MCGIAGAVIPAASGSSSICLDAALAALAHRGPDGEGQLQIAGSLQDIGLGHRRLSIIDLSDAGKQPMTSADGRYVISFNGEIYNYIELREELQQEGRRFQTRTDTEVLLQALDRWGEDALPRLDGMFAFALFDKQEQTLICARDAFGIKPFFYASVGDVFTFASELPALLKIVPGQVYLNWQRVYLYLRWGDYDDGADTFYRNVFQLLPGSLLKLRAGEKPEIKRWWWPSIEERSSLSFEDAADRVRQLFLQNVKRQLRSDVPVGAALSGGVDSSSIVCAIRHIEPDIPIRTFSYAATGSSLDERPWSQIVVEHVGAEAHWIAEGVGGLAAQVDNVIAAQGEPFGSTSIIASFLVFQRMRESGVTVALEGQGADECLAGYDGYPTAIFRDFIEQREFCQLGRFVRQWSQWPGRGLKRAALHLGDTMQSDWIREALLRTIGQPLVPDWINPSGLEKRGVEPCPMKSFAISTEGRGRRLSERLRTALTENRLPALLRHGDRNSMHWSVESRVPFLSPALAEFTLTLPREYLVSQEGETKHVFRRAMRGIVPDAILRRRDKIGFETPERAVMNLVRHDIDRSLEVAKKIDLFNHTELKKRVGSVLDGNGPVSFQAWRIANLCRWIELQPSNVVLD